MKSFFASITYFYIRHTLLTWETLQKALVIIGAMWSLVAAANFFSEPAGKWLKSHLMLLMWLALIILVVLRRPVLAITHRLKGRNVSITVRIGNIFSVRGSCVVSTNTTFDTDMGSKYPGAVPVISEGSQQGQFTKRFYTSTAHLDTDLDTALTGVPYEKLVERRGKKKRYPIGTVAAVRAKNKLFYLLAATHMNPAGTCEKASLGQVQDAITYLWEYIAKHGELGSVAIGIIGTGHGRMKEPRDKVAQEIINSFIAACAESVFCSDLTIVIHPGDYKKQRMNLHALGDYLGHVCRYAAYEGTSTAGSGVAIP